MEIISYLLGKNASGGSSNNYNAEIDSTKEYDATYGVKSLITNIKSIDLSPFAYIGYMFQDMIYLETVGQLDTSNATIMDNMFNNCRRLEDLPLFDTSKITSMTNAFYFCIKLTDESIDNILQMCINATSYSGTKTLTHLGFHSVYIAKSKIEALPHYQDFIDAGWTIGY